MWVAVDKSERCFVYRDKPIKKDTYYKPISDWYWETDINLFPNLKFEDGPLAVELVEVKR